MSKLILVLCSFFALCVSAQEFKGGQFVESIKCKANPKWSYAVYLPKDYDHTQDRKWSTMICFGASKGGTNALKKMVEGAELTNSILISSIETSNNTKNNAEGMKATIADVQEKFKVSENFLFVTGFSGGARRAFYANSMYKKPIFTGVFPCGAGGSKTSKERKVFFFGACGTNCFNREEMASSFRGLKKQGKLIYFPGAHAWAGEKEYTEGMAWLYAQNLNNVSTSEYDKFYSPFYERMKKKLDAETDTYEKYHLYETLSFVKGFKEASNIRREFQNMQRSKEIQEYLKAEKDYQKFLAKYYRKSYSDTSKKPLNAKAQKDATKFMEKYPNVPQTALLKKLVDKAAK
ncbi:MAG: hypothetical protein NE334_01660 [Lentisphaeraceae bacterium]|nr:hypothetical protein [Lentisphaeraceae bacterium]